MNDVAGRTQAVRQRALGLGFNLVGIAPAVSPPGYHRLLEWLASGYAADMHWVERRIDAYQHPDGVMPGTRSVIMAAMNYYQGTPPAAGPRVARYAWGTVDYHVLLRSRLRELAAILHELSPGSRTRVVVDTAPLLERDFARLSGLGWFGKNTMLISRSIGSWFLLGAVLTDAELEYDRPHESDHCGTCTRCLDICPTEAFPAAGVLDASRCISYLTIEHRTAPIPESLRSKIGPWVFGCDLCQDVCPWNRFAPHSRESAFDPQSAFSDIDCIALLGLDEPQFRQRFAETPLLRTGRAALLRNAAIVLGNLRCQQADQALQTALADAEAMIRGAAAWALGQLQLPSSRSSLERRLSIEKDPVVRQEMQSAISRLGECHQ